ncbi:unnamed protein product [Bursaphelenchus okinawaensis]|uniref:Major facilitator superfamily (MFS) profile domain-containing protein n=1 Tax=Bursaphelenchus okinawaensis TaxID=465554 RepID=A0A811KLX2_9BILA|nr:unnamed protein product [Bursaphelenchus okinawaensis]CAG9104944.1 unnamed protein product [Bursaphelenchus okinawaensis]
MRNKADAAQEANEDALENELENVGIIEPPDGGYGWVVVFASFMANMIVDGVIFSISETIVPLWEKEFNTTTSMATVSPSLLAGCYLLSGPLASALANQYGCDKVAILGAIIAAAGFLISVMVPALPVLYFTFGIVGGVGYGLIFLPAVVIVGQYFSEKRALATGIAVCGSGIGTSLLSYINPIVLGLLNNNWRFFLVFIAGITLLTVIFGYFFKPLQPSTQQLEKVTEITENYIVKHAEDEVEPEITSSPHVAHGVAIERFKSPSMSQSTRHLGENRPFLSTIELHAIRNGEKNALSHHDLASAVSKASMADLNRPLSKMDIFYPGSTTKLAERHGSTTKLRSVTNVEASTNKSSLYLSNIGLPTAEDYLIDQKDTWHRGILSPLQSMLDTTLLTSPSFLILAVGGFLTLACFFVPFMFIGQLARTNGVEPEHTKYLVVILGLVNLVARVLCGVISDHPKVDPLVVSNWALIIGGVATILVPFANTFFLFALYCLPFAFGVACFAALRSVICVELLGVEKLTNAYGILLMFMGVAALAGPPFAALLKNLTNSFNMSFYVMGVLMTLSGFISLPLRKVNEWETRKNESNTANPVELQPLNK